MADLPIEKLLPRANHSIYKLVSMAAARALELSEGRRCLVDEPASEKLTSRALEEIAEGKIELKEVADGRGNGKAAADSAEEKAPKELVGESSGD